MKKLVALILSISIVLVPCFAYADTASGSSLTFDEQLWIMNAGGIKPIQVAAAEANDTKATTANTDVFINGYAMPSNMNFYYFGSGSQATTFSNAYSQLPYLFQAVTYSIAYSTQNLNTKIQTALTTLNTAVSNIKTGIADINGYSGSISTDTSNIYSRLGTMNTSLNNLKTYTDGVETTLTNILTAIQNQSLTIPQVLIDNVQTLTDNQVPNSQFAWPSGFNSNFTINRYRQVADGGLSSDLTINPTNGTMLSRIWYWFANYSNSAVFAFRDLTSGVSPNTTKQYLNSSLQSVNLGRTSLWVDLRTLGVNINDAVMKLAYVLASDDEIAARQAAAANTQSAVNNFVSSSGSASVSTSNLGDLAGFTSSVTDNIVPGTASPTLLVNTLNNDDVWSWFTQSTADALEPPSRLRNESKSSDPSVSGTPLLDSYYRDLEQALGVYYDR